MKTNTAIRLLLLLLFLPLNRIVALSPDDRRFPRDPKVEVNPEYTALFESTYEASRADFLLKAARLSVTFPKAEQLSIPVPTQLGTPLYIDLLYIPPTGNRQNLLVISSGIHGVEGFAGSAIQRMIMTRFLTPENLSSTGVLLIHAMNPYGFNYIRRVTENNVDLNRNCDATRDLFNTRNDGYTKLYGFINPDKPASLGSPSNVFFVERARMHLFPNPPKNPQVLTGTGYIFSGYPIDWGDSKDFYTISGDFSELIGKLLPDKLLIPMTLEFGTMNSQKTMGSLHSIQNMILENQGFHYGYKNKRSERKIKEWFREMYAPSSPAWQTLVMNQSDEIFRQVFEKLK